MTERKRNLAGERKAARKRYRTDAEYRRKNIASAARCQAQNMADPLFRELRKIRNKITDKRSALARTAKRMQRHEIDLLRLIKQRDAAHKAWMESR